MKLTKRKIAFIKANASAFTVVSCISMQHAGSPEQCNVGMQWVVNVIDAISFFKNTLSGKEYATINSVTNGDNLLINIEVVSVSPNGKDHSRYIMFITCDQDTHYKLLK